MRSLVLASSILFHAALAIAIAAENYADSTAAPLVPAPQPGPAYLEAGPMLGHVSDVEARIWVKATAAAKLALRVSETAGFANARTIEGPQLSPETAFAGHAVVGELKPATRYFYSALLDGQPATVRPWPSFVTAPAAGTKGRLRFAFGSCAGKEPWLDAATWADLEARTSVDLMLMLGDNHYANTSDPDKQRAAYTAHRRNPGFAALTRRVPLYGIWDDHDYGPNDSDGTLAGKELSLRTFKEFFPNPSFGEADNPGVYFKLTRGDVDFFMLDGRYHRTPNKTPDDGTKTMLGTQQLEWLKRGLLESNAAVKFIASGSEWQSQSTKDCWPSFARERREILDFLAGHEMRNVVFLSGDRHFTALYQLDEGFLEVTSGPLGSPNSKIKTPPPEMIFFHDHGKIYAVLEVDTTAHDPQLALEVYETGVGLITRRKLAWKEVTGVAKLKQSGRDTPVAD